MTRFPKPKNWHLVVYAFACAFCILITDQYSKWMVLNVIMQPPQSVPIAPFINFDLVWNKGMTFGMLHNDHDYMRYIFVLAAGIIALWLLSWLWRTEDRWTGFAIGLILGGAIGNIIDRFRFGAVVDFIHVSFYPWVFNVADSAIVIGVGILLLESALTRRSG